MITDEEAEAAAEYIRASASALAKAKSERIYLHEYRKSQKALLVQQASVEMIKSTVDQRESFAYAHEDYLGVLRGLRDAVETEEKIRWKMEAARITCSLYQTQEATNRTIDRSHV